MAIRAANVSLALLHALRISDDLEFLNAIVSVGPPRRCLTDAEFGGLPRSHRHFILVRALWLKLRVGDIRDLLEESVCGGYVRDLKLFLGVLGARRAVEFLRAVEAAFPDGIVPIDEDRRRSSLAEIDRQQPRLLDGLTEQYLQHREEFVALLRKYIEENLKLIAGELSMQ